MAMDAAQYWDDVSHIIRRWDRCLSSGNFIAALTMLEQLLAHIKAGGTLETGELAVKLGTSPQMVDAMLEHLRLSGYIQAYSDCGDGCQGCGLKSSCGSGERARTIRLWQSSSLTK